MGILEIDWSGTPQGIYHAGTRPFTGRGDAAGRSICSTANEAGTCFNITTNPGAQFPGRYDDQQLEKIDCDHRSAHQLHD